MAVFGWAAACATATENRLGNMPLDHEWVLQAGGIHIADEDEEELFGSLELRLRQNWNGIRPWAGIFLVDATDTWAAGGGLMYEATIWKHFRVAVGSGPFYYHHGNGPDLGKSLEFYSFIEGAYAFSNGGRIGLRLGHFSNAGLSDRNPGTETLGVLVSFPL